jgi:hypothetical protein
MVLLWCYYGVTVVILWCSCGVAMVLLWWYHGIAEEYHVHLPQDTVVTEPASGDTGPDGVAVVLQWCYSGVTVVLQWCVWCYSGVALTPSRPGRRGAR